MRAVRFEEYGTPEVLHVEDVPQPVPAPGQVLVRVVTSGINPGEAKIRDGSMAEMFPATFPSGQGSDFAGIVAAVGDGVDDARTGTPVLGWSDERSAHAEFVAVPEGQLVQKPDALAWDVAGCLVVAGTTAWAAVQAVGVSSGDTVLIGGAAGGVGAIATQLALIAGGRVLAVAGPDNQDWLRGLGAEPLPYGDELEARVRAAAPDGVDAVIDTFGTGYVDLGLALGVAADRIDTIADFAAAARTGVKTDGNAAGARPDVVDQLVGLIVAGRLDVPIAAAYPLEDVAAAYTRLAEGHIRGKIALRVSPAS